MNWLLPEPDVPHLRRKLHRLQAWARGTGARLKELLNATTNTSTNTKTGLSIFLENANEPNPCKLVKART
jgi:hypothetical protein